MIIDDRRYLDALLRNDLLAFMQRVFRELRPGQTYRYCWHHEAIAYVVGKTAIDREMNRLIINVPPRSLKSMMVSVALPAFLLGRDPTRRIIVVSYNQDLAQTFSRDCRQVMQSNWYKQLFPSTRLFGRAAETEFASTAGGFRMAASTNGTLTGRGGDLIIIDDPAKADDAYSSTARENLVDWATRTLFTRLDDKREGAIILVQQRQHIDDLTGHMLRAGGWYHLSLPAIAVKAENIILSGSPRLRVHRRYIGDLLDPQREPQPVLDDLRAQMGVSAFEAQYQQNPSPPDGDAVKISWFRRYRELPAGGRLIMSVDTAMKAGLRNDWSVCQLWQVVENRFYLHYVWRRRVEFPELLHSVIDIARTTGPDTILIEDKGSGTGLVQSLREHVDGFPAVAYDPGSLDKEQRMKIQSAKIEGGTVFIPEAAPWLDAFFDEVGRFPNGTHDDQIDAMSQVLDYGSKKPSSFFMTDFRGNRLI